VRRPASASPGRTALHPLPSPRGEPGSPAPPPGVLRRPPDSEASVALLPGLRPRETPRFLARRSTCRSRAARSASAKRRRAILRSRRTAAGNRRRYRLVSGSSRPAAARSSSRSRHSLRPISSRSLWAGILLLFSMSLRYDGLIPSSAARARRPTPAPCRASRMRSPKVPGFCRLGAGGRALTAARGARDGRGCSADFRGRPRGAVTGLPPCHPE